MLHSLPCPSPEEIFQNIREDQPERKGNRLESFKKKSLQDGIIDLLKCDFRLTDFLSKRLWSVSVVVFSRKKKFELFPLRYYGNEDKFWVISE